MNESQKRERPDPTEGDRPWPLYIWIIVLVFTCFGTCYIVLFAGNGEVGSGDFRAEQTTAIQRPRNSDETQMDVPQTAVNKINGQAVFQNVCAACHQSNGQGVPGAFPPLAGSSWVTGPPEIPVKILLGGLQGPVLVKGKQYNGVMPNFSSSLSDEEIAAVVSYIRNSWENSAPETDSKLVESVRSQMKARNKPWAANELRS